MDRLFDDNDNLTQEARDLDSAVQTALKPIIEAEGLERFSIRDIEFVVHNAISARCALIALERGLKRRRQRREADA